MMVLSKPLLPDYPARYAQIRFHLNHRLSVSSVLYNKPSRLQPLKAWMRDSSAPPRLETRRGHSTNAQPAYPNWSTSAYHPRDRVPH